MGDTGTPRASSSSSAKEKEEETAVRGGEDMVVRVMLVGDAVVTILLLPFPVRVFSVDSELRARPKP